jgi:Flp pilus assembly protein TadG
MMREPSASSLKSIAAERAIGKRSVMAVVHDASGAVLVEVTVTMALMLVFILGSIDFLFAFYQWNAATKAVQVGARIAAVSDPVAIGLNGLSAAVVNSFVPPGAQMPNFAVRCERKTESCRCVGACASVGAYNPVAMNTIIFGRGSSSCSDATSIYRAGMCDIFSRIADANVIVQYVQTGLGYAGRPGGPAPTITVSIEDLPFQFIFLSGIMRNGSIPIPALTTSITAEDLASSAPSF